MSKLKCISHNGSFHQCTSMCFDCSQFPTFRGSINLKNRSLYRLLNEGQTCLLHIFLPGPKCQTHARTALGPFQCVLITHLSSQMFLHKNCLTKPKSKTKKSCQEFNLLLSCCSLVIYLFGLGGGYIKRIM